MSKHLSLPTSQTANPSLGRETGFGRLSDYVALTKPRITLMVLLTAAGGMWLAPGVPTLIGLSVALVSLALVVSAANVLNCYLEREPDRLMSRTMGRPLPAARLAARPALVFGVVLGLLAIPALVFLVNPVTGALGALSLFLYAGVYTPLKQYSPSALLVGAVPGAMPPLMGWTAATGSVDLAGLALFGVLFAWQIPHFIAIATFREEEYVRAGHRVLPAVRGRRVSYVHAVSWAALLVLVSVTFQALGLASLPYTVVAALVGVWFLAVTAVYLRPAKGDAGARKVFVASLIYLPLLLLALALFSR